MNTAKQSINLLDVLTLDELKALTDEELRRFEALLSHWQQLAQGERKKRCSQLDVVRGAHGELSLQSLYRR